MKKRSISSILRHKKPGLPSARDDALHRGSSSHMCVKEGMSRTKDRMEKEKRSGIETL